MTTFSSDKIYEALVQRIIDSNHVQALIQQAREESSAQAIQDFVNSPASDELVGERIRNRSVLQYCPLAILEQCATGNYSSNQCRVCKTLSLLLDRLPTKLLQLEVQTNEEVDQKVKEEEATLYKELFKIGAKNMNEFVQTFLHWIADSYDGKTISDLNENDLRLLFAVKTLLENFDLGIISVALNAAKNVYLEKLDEIIEPFKDKKDTDAVPTTS